MTVPGTASSPGRAPGWPVFFSETGARREGQDSQCVPWGIADVTAHPVEVCRRSWRPCCTLHFPASGVQGGRERAGNAGLRARDGAGEGGGGDRGRERTAKVLSGVGVRNYGRGGRGHDRRRGRVTAALEGGSLTERRTP